MFQFLLKILKLRNIQTFCFRERLNGYISQTPMKDYSHTIVGAGCAGLQLVEALKNSGEQDDLRILLLEKAGSFPKRTWCMWAKKKHTYDHLVTKRWKKLRFAGPNRSIVHDLGEWEYQYIAGKDFFDYHHQQISSDPRIEIRQETFLNQKPVSGGSVVKTDHGVYRTSKIYNSLPVKGVKGKSRHHLLQHFRGWFVKMEQPVFDPDVVTLMDFSIQTNLPGTQFTYVLPFSETEALVEFTVVSKDTFPRARYDQCVAEYLDRNCESAYEVMDTEEGAIPMTDFQFPLETAAGMVSIGGRAGRVKPTTGYAFNRIMEDTQALVNGKRSHSPARFRFYDRLLLRILNRWPKRFPEVMESLFLHQPISRIFRFLDERSHLGEEVNIFRKLPIRLFLTSLSHEIVERLPYGQNSAPLDPVGRSFPPAAGKPIGHTT